MYIALDCSCRVLQARRAGKPDSTVDLKKTNMKQTIHAATCCLALALASIILTRIPSAAQEQATKPTAMGKLAAGMKVGEWAELKTDNLVEAHRAKGASGAIFGYNEGAAWDPRSRQWLYCGGDHNDRLRFVTFSADSNTWKIMPEPDWVGKGTSHGYDHNAIDHGRGIFYYRPFSSPIVRRYDVAADKWSALPKIDTSEYLACCVGL